MSKTMVDQIDLIATVASAFSEFAKLPEKNNEIINLNNEVEDILRVLMMTAYLCILIKVIL